MSNLVARISIKWKPEYNRKMPVFRGFVIEGDFCSGVTVFTNHRHYSLTIFSIGIVGSAVQLGPLGTTATNRPVVQAPYDYDDGEIGGMMIGRGNRSTRRKPAPVPLRWEASD
jgi:hypothetical protein